MYLLSYNKYIKYIMESDIEKCRWPKAAGGILSVYNET
jgi:hypothetical protein